MTATSQEMNPIEPEAELAEIDSRTFSDSRPPFSVSIKRHASTQDRPWKSSAAFHTIFDPEDNNYKVYNVVVAPNNPKILCGKNCSSFAYGHSGSGKTHTILGYDFQDKHDLAIGFSLFELRKKSAFDLLNHRTQCHIREGPDGKVHVRGEPEILEEGKVRVRPIVQRPCWNFESFQRRLVQALGQRAIGSSSVHDQSSRTHAVLQLEISEFVPVGKRAIDISIEEEMKSVIRTPDGVWAPNRAYRKNQERIDAAEAEKAQFEARVTAAEEEIKAIFKSSTSPCLGAKMVFVDLAGAEYFGRNWTQLQTNRQTQERQEGRQINTDLLALKEVMRAWSQGQKRIPFRSSTLTMVLRERFMSTGKGNSSIIVTLSPATEQYAATLNSLKYASLVGVVNA
ncbi:hypothetical protein AAE478_008998 [Parahypoxylon ruwenzoriense]